MHSASCKFPAEVPTQDMFWCFLSTPHPSTGAGSIWQIRGHFSPGSWTRCPGLTISPERSPHLLPSVLHLQSFDAQKKLPPEFFWKNASLSHPATFLTEKEVSQELWLEPGMYVIVPCTSEDRQESEFILRVFSRKHIF